LTEDEQVRSKRHRQDAATDASLLLVQDALVQIRAMAYLRKNVGAGDDDGDAPGDYHERIRLIADVCENLPRYLRLAFAERPRRGCSTYGIRPARRSGYGCAQPWLSTASS